MKPTVHGQIRTLTLLSRPEQALPEDSLNYEMNEDEMMK